MTRSVLALERVDRAHAGRRPRGWPQRRPSPPKRKPRAHGVDLARVGGDDGDVLRTDVAGGEDVEDDARDQIGLARVAPSSGLMADLVVVPHMNQRVAARAARSRAAGACAVGYERC